MDEPLLDSAGEDKSGLPSWLDPEKDEDHRSLISGGASDSGHGNNAPRTSSLSWADDSLPIGGGGAAGAGSSSSSELPKLILGIRIVNIGAAIALMTCSISINFYAMQGTLSLTQWVLAGYGASAGILLFCLETQLKFLRGRIADNFGFLFDPFLRFLFLLLTASMSWLHRHLFSDAVAIAMMVVAVLNLYAMCRYPTYGEMRDKLAKEEDRLLERRIRPEVTRQAVRNATGTESDWL